jgi:hypothetical protein
MHKTRWIVLATLIGPTVTGGVAWAVTGQWRWPITGVLVGAALLAVVIAVSGFLDTDPDAGGPGCAFVLLVLFALGPLFGLTMWLWTGNAYWGLGAALVPLLGLLVLGILFTLNDT